MIKGILFDKDGTLIDFNRTWLPLYERASDYLATEAGQPDRAAELMKAGGFLASDRSWQPDSVLASGSNQQIYTLWSDLLEFEMTAHHHERCRQIFQLKHGNYAPVLDDLDDFLLQLQARGLALGVATMDDEASAVSTLDGLGCLQRFDFVCGADSGFGVKPDPGMVLAFCKQCKLDPTETMMVGDSPRDLRMGSNAGVALSIGVLTGAATRQTLEPDADHVYENISGLLELLTG